MRKIRVGLLIDEFFGGAGTAYGGYGFLARKYIAKYIPDKRVTMDVLLEMKEELTEITAEKVDDILIYKFPKDEERVKEWLERQNYDLFLSIELTWPSYEILKLVDHKKLVLWIQDPRPPSLWDEKRKSMTTIQDPCVCDPLVSNLVNEMFYQGRVKFISQGNSLNKRAFELYNLPENAPVQLLPNPVEIDYKYKFDIHQKKKQVVFLGRLEAQKRAWLFCEVAKHIPEYEFYVLGKFFRHEEENKKPLEPYLSENIPNLHLMGHLEGEEKEKILRESRILLNTSIWEGIPISWLECLQYGTLPVSCLDNENLPSRFGAFTGEIFGDGYADVEKFIPAIRELMENDDLYTQKALAAIDYTRKNHNIKKFQKNLRKVLLANPQKVNRVFENPVFNQIDVKITYACNYKCEYCYQVDDQGYRLKGVFEQKNIDHLINFMKKTKLKYIVNLVGGEPFVYPHLNEFAEKLIKNGHTTNTITNFSAPFEKIEKFLRIVKNDLLAFSISLHISQLGDIESFYEKLERLVNLKITCNCTWPIFMSCVITEENFDKAIEISNQIQKRHGITVMLQRVYYDAEYEIYSERIEDYFKSHKLDVPLETINTNHYGRYCWSGVRFFYIEYNGSIQRCYTPQDTKGKGTLGNLSRYQKIKLPDEPYPCLHNGNCICFKHFISKKYVSRYCATDNEIAKLVACQLTGYQNSDYLKYLFYRVLSNMTFGETREAIIKKKLKYKENLHESEPSQP